jgi:hypothetical protein
MNLLTSCLADLDADVPGECALGHAALIAEGG